MVPEGLVLMTSLAFAVGAVRHGRRNVLTRELAAIEGLARVDVLLVDKTGTLTIAGMRVTGIEAVPASGSVNEVTDARAALAASDHDPNPTMTAIAITYPRYPDGPHPRSYRFRRRVAGAAPPSRGTARGGSARWRRSVPTPVPQIGSTRPSRPTRTTDTGPSFSITRTTTSCLGVRGTAGSSRS